jgi:CRISPR/Cas system-associated endoribonuclease Cas2
MSKTQLVKNNKQAKQILSSHAFWIQNFIFKTNLSRSNRDEISNSPTDFHQQN